jgi:uncharacterized membrane protein
MSADSQLYLALGYCLLLVILAVIFYKNPPKEINSLYGYRTPRSQANPTIWKAANDFSRTYMLKVCLASFALPFLGYLLFSDQNLIITVVVHTVLVVSTFFTTEQYLNTNFDKEGNPK